MIKQTAKRQFLLLLLLDTHQKMAEKKKKNAQKLNGAKKIIICLFCCMKSHRYATTPPEKYQQMGFHYELIYLLEPRTTASFLFFAQEIRLKRWMPHCINFDMNIYIDARRM